MSRARIALVVAAVGLVALVAWLLVPPSEEPFYDYVAKLKAAGEPTTFAEAHGPMPPEEENAAPEIDAALEWMHGAHGRPATWTVTGPWDSKAMSPLEETITPEQRAALQQFLGLGTGQPS